jgi:hypothetical protein
MNQTEVRIRLESTEGETTSYISSLRQDIEAELSAAADEEGVSLQGPEETRPPEGTQGLPELIQWGLQIASDNPKDVLYPVLLALREILRHYRSREEKQDSVTIRVIIEDRQTGGTETLDLSQKDLVLNREIEKVDDEHPSEKE